MSGNKITIGVKFSGLPIDKFKNLKIDASGLSNKEREKLPVEVNESVFFSSKISDAKLLAKMHDYILRAARGESGYHRDDFSKKIRAYFGLKPWEGGTKMSDITSTARLDLIFEHNLAKMAYRSQYLTSLKDIHVYPAQELVRILRVKEPRDWVKRWRDAGGKFYGGRMIAPILDPIWIKISRFGLPYPPFDYNSGMGLRPISAKNAVELGVMTKKEVLDLEGKRVLGIGEFPDESGGFVDITGGGGFNDDGNAGMSGQLPEPPKPPREKSTKKKTSAQETEPPQKEAPTRLDDIPFTLDTTPQEKAVSVSVKAKEEATREQESPQKPTSGFHGKLIGSLMASFLAFFGSQKVARGQTGQDVIFTGEAGNLAAQAHDYAKGESFTIEGFSPKNSHSPLLNAGNSAELALRQFDSYVFSSMPKNEAQICAMVLKSPSRVRYNKAAGRFVISKQCGEKNHYVIALPQANRALLVSYAGERGANYDSD